MQEIDLSRDVEGKDYIAISKYSKTKLGKQLMPGYPVEFNTVFGKVGNILAAKQYLTRIGYISHFKSKKRLSSVDIENINKLPTVKPVNQKAILIYLIAERLMGTDLVNDIRKLKRGIKIIPLNIKESNRLGINVKLTDTVNEEMKEYCAALKDVVNLIHSDKFNSAGVSQLIKRSKSVRNSNLFDNCAIDIMEI